MDLVVTVQPSFIMSLWVWISIVVISIEIDGEKILNAKGKQLFVPKALCLLSHQPMFSAFAIFLRYIKNAYYNT